MSFWVIFGIVAIIIMFAYAIVQTMGAESYPLMEEDKKAILLHWKEPTDEIRGNIALLIDKFIFTDENGQKVIEIPYREITQCKMNSSNYAGIVRGTASFGFVYHYLDIEYRQNNTDKKSTFKFNHAAAPYVKDLCKEIKNRITAPK